MADPTGTLACMTTITALLTTLTLTLGTGPLEDEPGWDCTTMGNRICGTVTDTGYEPDTGEYAGGYN